jgi:hypothetical protein
MASPISCPDCPRVGELFSQLLRQARGQHDDAILGAFTMTHDDRFTIEVEILDAQAQTLQQSQAGTVKQLTDEPMPGIQRREKCSYFSPRQRAPAVIARAPCEVQDGCVVRIS